MMGNIANKQPQVFFTKENSIGFIIHPNLSAELSEDNLDEILKNIEKLPRDSIVIDKGIEIRRSLTIEQKKKIIEALARITQNDVDYIENYEVVDISDHVGLEYLLNNPQLLKRRGWSSDEIELINQIHSTLANAEEIDKAHLDFDATGDSDEYLTWTMIGDDNGVKRKLTIKFQSAVISEDEDGPEEIIVVITVKAMN